MVKDCQKCAADRQNHSEPFHLPWLRVPWQKVAVHLMKFEAKWYSIVMDPRNFSPTPVDVVRRFTEIKKCLFTFWNT